MIRARWLALFSVVLAIGVVTPAQAQIWKKVKEKVKAQTDTLIDKGLDVAAGSIKCVIGVKACMQKAQTAGKPVVLTDKGGKVLPAEQQPPAQPKAAEPAVSEKASVDPGQGAFANYDFVPGERILFKDDFTGDRVGNFPQKLEFIAGNAEVVTWNGGRWLRATAPTAFAVPLPEVLPDRFTIEFQVTLPWWGMIVYGGPDGDQRSADLNGGARQHSFITLGCCEVGIKGARGQGGSVTDARPQFALGPAGIDGHLFNVRVQGDGKYLKLYLEEKRLANIPNSTFNRTNKLIFVVRPSDKHPVMIGNISVNAGGTAMYDALLANGRFATQGILFDVDSDHIRPESTPTLNEIAEMLQSHPELKILIEGHTDNSGVAAHNQTLSEQRAAAVKAYLVGKSGIDGARLQSQGFGATKPAASNATAEGRQSNRRVELVKL